MSSQRRIEASRANGARSRGPVSVEGKQRSAANAIRHGMLSGAVVLRDEDPAEFHQLLEHLIECFQPADNVQLSLVEEMASAQWRQRRSWAIETRMMDDAAATAASGDSTSRMTHAFTSLASGPELALMHRYETRQTRVFQRALHNLLLLQKRNLPNEPNPKTEQLSGPPEPAEGPLDSPPEPPESHDDPLPPAAGHPVPPAGQSPFANLIPDFSIEPLPLYPRHRPQT